MPIFDDAHVTRPLEYPAHPLLMLVLAHPSLSSSLVKTMMSDSQDILLVSTRPVIVICCLRRDEKYSILKVQLSKTMLKLSSPAKKDISSSS